MTLDEELLSRIKYKIESCNRQDIDSTGWSALCEIVKLCIHFNNSTVTTEFLISLIEKELNK